MNQNIVFFIIINSTGGAVRCGGREPGRKQPGGAYTEGGGIHGADGLREGAGEGDKPAARGRAVRQIWGRQG